MLGVEKKRKKESSLHSLLSDNFSFDFKYPPVTVIEKNWQKLFYKWVKINLKLKKVNNRDWKHHFWGNWLDLVLWFLGKNTLSKCRNLSSVIIRLLWDVYCLLPSHIIEKVFKTTVSKGFYEVMFLKGHPKIRQLLDW